MVIFLLFYTEDGGNNLSVTTITPCNTAGSLILEVFAEKRVL
jgi:hypothetical protein